VGNPFFRLTGVSVALKVLILATVIVLIGFLLVFAFLDAIATRNYARRQRRALYKARFKMAVDMVRHSRSSHSGHGSSGTADNARSQSPSTDGDQGA
jgi:Flp pilus assembly protein TadB